ncbi:MAG TPA: hypothetical protein VJL80_06330 [Aeromicrobium sp.]|nr:hypothetical protein [Aeromicrobium sp.]HKY57636.1 hypothetical protein [Aeromicrobium sp.]
MNDREISLSTVAAWLLWATAFTTTSIAIACRIIGEDDAAFCFYGLTLLVLAAAIVTTIRCYMRRVMRLIRALHSPPGQGEGFALSPVR